MTSPIPLNLPDDAHARLRAFCAHYHQSAEYIVETLLWQASLPTDDNKPMPKHTDRSVPCPTCGFRIRTVPAQPFRFEDDHD